MLGYVEKELQKGDSFFNCCKMGRFKTLQSHAFSSRPLLQHLFL